MLREMDFPVIFGIALAVRGALYLLDSRGKPPEWEPRHYRRFKTPRFLWGRDRVRALGLSFVLFGLAFAFLWEWLFAVTPA